MIQPLHLLKRTARYTTRPIIATSGCFADNLKVFCARLAVLVFPVLCAAGLLYAIATWSPAHTFIVINIILVSYIAMFYVCGFIRESAYYKMLQRKHWDYIRDWGLSHWKGQCEFMIELTHV